MYKLAGVFRKSTRISQDFSGTVMSKNSGDLYEFGPFRLDPAQRLLLREEKAVPLQPKAFDTLLLLVRNSEKVVLKHEILNA
jgi:DNA-binding winged helix-turn-helix (wHTH) protein